MYVVAVGNGFEGYKLIGPFWSESAANEWAAREYDEASYMIVRVEDVPLGT